MLLSGEGSLGMRWSVVPFLAGSLLASVAQAQPYAWGPAGAPTVVTATLRGEEPNLHLVLYAEDPSGGGQLDRPITVCNDTCRLSVPPGNYRLEVSGPADGPVRTGTTSFTIAEDAEVGIEPAHRTGRSLGLAAGIAGTVIATGAEVVMGIGFMTLMGDCFAVGCEQDKNRRVLRLEEIGGGVLVAGGIIAALGFTSFAHNSGPTLKVVPAPAKPAAAGNLRLGLVRMHAGWGLGGALEF